MNKSCMLYDRNAKHPVHRKQAIEKCMRIDSIQEKFRRYMNVFRKSDTLSFPHWIRGCHFTLYLLSQNLQNTLDKSALWIFILDKQHVYIFGVRVFFFSSVTQTDDGII